MYYDCQSFGQFPRVGGWHEQDDMEMDLMKITNRAAEVYSKQGRGQALTPEDAEFIVWVEAGNTDG